MNLLQQLAKDSTTKGYQTTIMELYRIIEQVPRKDLAAALNIHPSTLSKWLSNPDNLSLRNAFRLYNAAKSLQEK